MNSLSGAPAAIAQSTPSELALSGYWTARGIGAIEPQLDALSAPSTSEMVVNGAGIEALDTAGAWVLQKLLQRLRGEGTAIQVRGLRQEFARLLEVVGQQVAEPADGPSPAGNAPPSMLEGAGRSAEAALEQAVALLSFVGESAAALAGSIAHPARFRWRAILYNVRSAGFDALPIVGLLSFLLGIVVAY